MTGLRAVSDAGSAAWTTGVANAMMDTLWSRGSDGRSFLGKRLSASAKAALGTALAVTAEALGPAMPAAATAVTSLTRTAAGGAPGAAASAPAATRGSAVRASGGGVTSSPPARLYPMFVLTPSENECFSNFYFFLIFFY